MVRAYYGQTGSRAIDAMRIEAGLDYVRFILVTGKISSPNGAGASVTSRLGITKTIRGPKNCYVIISKSTSTGCLRVVSEGNE